MGIFLAPFNQRLAKSKYIKEISQILISKEINPQYNHLTFEINSLIEYIQVITAITNIHHEKLYNFKNIYRGMSDSDWLLMPSLARNKAKSSYCAEYDMVSEMISEKPEEFNNLSYNLELLAKMQHYGLPTRLLDFTFSPLIALYFACCEKKSKSGRVIVGEADVHYYNEPIIEAICGLYKLPYCNNVLIEDWLMNYNVNLHDYFRMTYMYNINVSLLTFVKPLYINERMRVQQSVFAVFCNEVADLGARVTYRGLNDSPRFNEEILRHENIKKIYSEYISSPDMSFWVDSEKIDDIWKSYKNEDKKICDIDLLEKMLINRFGLSEYIRSIEPYDIFANYCSIIINKDCKSTIINELSKLGIDRSFVYPELEYTAEKVKNKVIG